MTFVSRDDWGAGGLGSGHRVPHSQFVGLAAHHTVAVMADYDRDGFLHGDLDDVKRYMRWLQHARPDLGDEVPYSFVVFEGSTADEVIVAEGRGFGVTGAHTKGYNSSRYGVAVAGNTSNRRVTPGMLEAYRWIGRKLSDPPGARPTIGHRDTKATECPGNDLYSKLDLIQPPFTAASGTVSRPEEDDMFEDDDRKLLREVVTAVRASTNKPGSGFNLNEYIRKIRDDTKTIRNSLPTLAQINLVTIAAGRLVRDEDPDQPVDIDALAAAVAEAVTEALPAALADLTPESIAGAVIEALPPELAQQVVAEIGTRLGELSDASQ